MIDFSDNHLLFIEPEGPPTTSPTVDELTIAVAHALDHAKVEESYFGHHTCICGACSDGSDWRTPDGFLTHTLAHFARTGKLPK